MSRTLVRHPLFAAIALGLLACLAAGHAQAEIYKCVDRSGKAIFTTEPGRCPGSQPHSLTGSIQTQSSDSGSSTYAKPRTPPARAAAVDADDGFEAMWRRKRGEVEQELEEASSRLTRLEAMARGCNRGIKWLSKDEAGLRSKIPCSEVYGREEKARTREQELREYLEQGLAEECRRAGCLPGWIR